MVSVKKIERSPVEMKRQTLSLLLVVVLSVDRMESSQEVMKAITLSFTKALDVCKIEMELPDTVDSELLSFWRAGREVSEPATGCAIICLSTKIGLAEADGSLRRGSAQQFAKANGADDTMALQLVDLVQQCESAAPVTDHACLRALGVARCFKTAILDLDWAPEMEAASGEVPAEV